MNDDIKKNKLIRLQNELDILEEQERSLTSVGKKSYNGIRIFILIIILICIVFQTCYIKDSLDINSGSFATTDEDTEKKEDNNDNQNDINNIKDDNKGPYNLDNNVSNNTNGNIHNNQNTNNTITEDSNTINNTTNDNNTTDIPDTPNIPEIVTEPVKDEELKDIKIIQETTKNGDIKKEDFRDLSNLEIFTSSTYLSEKLIYPELSGTYKFYIENYLSKNIKYKLVFDVENYKNTNIKYKLKRNGTYLVGNETTYEDASQLTSDNLVLESKNGDNYTLEWKWIETSYDNESTDTSNRAKYSLTIAGVAY